MSDRFKFRKKRNGNSLPHQPSNRVNKFLSHVRILFHSSDNFSLSVYYEVMMMVASNNKLYDSPDKHKKKTSFKECNQEKLSIINTLVTKSLPISWKLISRQLRLGLLTKRRRVTLTPSLSASATQTRRGNTKRTQISVKRDWWHFASC